MMQHCSWRGGTCPVPQSVSGRHSLWFLHIIPNKNTAARWVSSTGWYSGKLILKKKRNSFSLGQNTASGPSKAAWLRSGNNSWGRQGQSKAMFSTSCHQYIAWKLCLRLTGENCAVWCRDSWHLPLCAQVKAVDHKANRTECHHALTCHAESRLWQTAADCWEELVSGWQALIKSAAGNGYNKA